MKIKVTWEIEDGYCGKSRPQHTIVNTNDYTDSDEELEADKEWEEMDEAEKDKIIEDAVQEDFNYKINWFIKSKTIIK
jgi:hypothetical protein